jgi:hypothetical protein
VKADAPSGARPAPTRTERFYLDGPSRHFDPRIHAVRNDIADIALAGRLFAPHYAQPEPANCTATFTMVRAAPDVEAEAVSQLLLGEGFAILDAAKGWAWGYCLHDHYVGYVDANALGAASEHSHIVTAALGLVFAAPDIKSPVVARWPLGARFTGIESGGFVACNEGYMHRRHADRIDSIENDPVAVAERFTAAPYLWGGRGAGGIDCSGLIQIALARTGLAVPRDTDQQQAAEMGSPIAPNMKLRRGDLIFFPSHVGFMVDEERLIHANAHSMSVAIEPLGDLVARLKPNHDKPIRDRRRLKP